jgi:hypothetical protein
MTAWPQDDLNLTASSSSSTARKLNRGKKSDFVTASSIFHLASTKIADNYRKMSDDVMVKKEMWHGTNLHTQILADDRKWR